MADLGFPVGGRGLPRWLRFIKFVCQNERIGCAPLDPPMQCTEYNAEEQGEIPRGDVTSQKWEINLQHQVEDVSAQETASLFTCKVRRTRVEYFVC